MKEGFVVWMTGLSGAGKTTLANDVGDELRSRGLRVEILDGDEVRDGLSPGLGFSKEDRDAHIRRVGYLSKVLSRNGVVVIVAAISPYEETRRWCRDQVCWQIVHYSPEGLEFLSRSTPFLEVYVRCALEECENRDVKGLYAKARAGEIKNFTGIDDPYEAPRAPELVVDTYEMSQAACVEHILFLMWRRGLV